MNYQNLSRSLSGKRLVVTRSEEQAEALAHSIQKQGGEVLFFPVIEIHPPENWNEIDQTIDQLEDYDWIIFTSINAVRFFLNRFQEKGKKIHLPENTKICAIGEGTAQALQEFQVQVDAIPSKSVSESIAATLSEIENLKGKRILLPQSHIARKVLPTQLKEAGALVYPVVAYRTLPRSLSKEQILQLNEPFADWILFTSSSTVKNFIEQVHPVLGREWLTKVKLASIGPVTSETLREFQLEPTIESDQPGMDTLVDAIVQYEQSE